MSLKKGVFRPYFTMDREKISPQKAFIVGVFCRIGEADSSEIRAVRIK